MVAIIAVLVAVAVPTFSSQLEKAREGTDAANLRSAYAEVITARLGGDQTKKYYKAVPVKQTKAGWITDNDWPSNLYVDNSYSTPLSGIGEKTFQPESTTKKYMTIVSGEEGKAFVLATTGDTQSGMIDVDTLK